MQACIICWTWLFSMHLNIETHFRHTPGNTDPWYRAGMVWILNLGFRQLVLHLLRLYFWGFSPPLLRLCSSADMTQIVGWHLAACIHHYCVWALALKYWNYLACSLEHTFCHQCACTLEQAIWSYPSRNGNMLPATTEWTLEHSSCHYRACTLPQDD